MIWNDMTDSFKSELQSLYVHKNQFEVSWETLVAMYRTLLSVIYVKMYTRHYARGFLFPQLYQYYQY